MKSIIQTIENCIENLDVLEEAYPNLPNGMIIKDKGIIKDLVRLKIGSKSKWKPTANILPKHFKETNIKAFAGTYKDNSLDLYILGLPERPSRTERSRKSPTYEIYLLNNSGVTKQVTRSWNEIRNAKKINAKLKDSVNLDLSDFNLFITDIEVMKSSYERGKVLNFTPEVKIATDKILKILLKDLKDIQDKMITQTTIDTEKTFDLVIDTIRNPENATSNNAELSKFESRFYARYQNMSNFAGDLWAFRSRVLDVIYGSKDGLTHSNVKSIKTTLTKMMAQLKKSIQ